MAVLLFVSEPSPLAIAIGLAIIGVLLAILLGNLLKRRRKQQFPNSE